ncbi:hypothetical protein FS749_002020 [Ceratobasidium sp. UAMH 11750]|nr:hypothetical protein FS749_002020 [Ceratobasidium sp. UAMH 11750]
MMGHVLSIYDSPTTELKPGTYRIVNAATKTVVEAPDINRRKIIATSSLAIGDKHKMWFVQRAGRGYQLKNCHFGTYVVVQNVEASALVCGSEYPMTWVFHPIQGQDTFLLQVPGNDRVLSINATKTGNDNMVGVSR